MKKAYILQAFVLAFILSLSGTTQAQQTLFSCDFSNPTQYSTGIIGSNQFVGGSIITRHANPFDYSRWSRYTYNDLSTLSTIYYPVLIYQFGDFLSNSIPTNLQTPSNGFMLMSMIDSYMPWGGDGEQGAYDAYISFPAISTENQENLMLCFSQLYRCHYNDQCWIDYSTDGINWDCMEINIKNYDVPFDGYLQGPQCFFLPSSLENQPSVFLRIRWSSPDSYLGIWGYFWIVDDFSVVSVSNQRDYAINFVCPNELPLTIIRNSDTIDCSNSDSVWQHQSLLYRVEYNDSQYMIDSVFVDGSFLMDNHNAFGSCVFVLNNVTSNHIVSFSIKETRSFTIICDGFDMGAFDYVVNGTTHNGSGTFACGDTLGIGINEEVSVSVHSAEIQNPNYYFARWSDGNTDNPRTITINQDTTLTAIFLSKYYVTLLCEGEGSGSVYFRYNFTDEWSEVMCGFPFLSKRDVMLYSIPVEGSHFVGWSDGVTSNPRSLHINQDTSISAIFIPNINQDICMVTVSNNHNMIVWERGYEEVNNYLIYRETSTPGEYELVGTSPYDAETLWVDDDSKPSTRSYRYKMAVEDNYSNIHKLSSPHKTIHLYINKGMGNSWNLAWNEYEGAEFSTYMIFRGTSDGNMQYLDAMPVGGNNTYTDMDAPEDIVYYQVCVLKNDPCNPSKSDAMIRSNIATNNPAGINDIGEKPALAYSQNGRIIVDGVYNESVIISDVLGRVIYYDTQNGKEYTVSSSGVYFVKVGNRPPTKVIVSK